MATKPKKIKGQRITVAVPKSQRQGKTGRPVGSRQRRKFEETKLGFVIKYEAPIEYDIIMSSCTTGAFPEPDVGVIEIVANASIDPLFKKPRFWRYFEVYKRDGCFAPRAMKLTPFLKQKYDRVVENKIKSYVKAKRSDIKKNIINKREVK